MGKCKQKTHKASSKVLNKKKNGTITFKMGNGNHKTGKDSSKAVRQRRGTTTLGKAMAKGLSKTKLFTKELPYSKSPWLFSVSFIFIPSF